MTENLPIDQVLNIDVMELLKQLPDNSIDCVFGDPDYNVGVAYNGQSYTTSFEQYMDWYCELAHESMRVLKKTGNLFFINYPKQNSYLRVKCLDGISHEVFDYAWVYNSNIGHSKRRFTTAHRSILHATASSGNHFYKNNVAVPYKNPDDKRVRKLIESGSHGRMPYSWFYFDMVKNVSKEKTFHTCQIPQSLSSMLIKSCTQPGDTVLILFGGSGSEIAICQKTQRHFIAAELDESYHQMIQERIQNNGQILATHKR